MRFRLKVALLVGFITLLAPVGYWAGQRFCGNIHTVLKGEVYRSAQLPPDRLRALVREHNIRSIINLRGPAPDAAWYIGEQAVAAAEGVTSYDFPMSPKRQLTPEKVEELLTLMRTAPKPLLLHCREGSDRTGLAAALYMAKIKGVDLDSADKQLSVQYGHFPYIISETEEMDDTFWQTVDPGGNHEVFLNWY